MMASEVVQRLQELIAQHGDREVDVETIDGSASADSVGCTYDSHCGLRFVVSEDPE